jgi:hypothetical protein
VRGTVVHHPEHPCGRGIRFGGHHLGHQLTKRCDTGGGSDMADQLGAVHVLGALSILLAGHLSAQEHPWSTHQTKVD